MHIKDREEELRGREKGLRGNDNGRNAERILFKTGIRASYTGSNVSNDE